MATENSTADTEDLLSQLDTVKRAQKLLKENGEKWCQFHPREDGKGRRHEHGSVDCIATFLGSGYSANHISELLKLDLVHPDIQADLRGNLKGTHGQGPLGIKAGAALSALAKRHGGMVQPYVSPHSLALVRSHVLAQNIWP